MIPTKLPVLCREILLNSKFDYTSLTLKDVEEILKFWIYRHTRPKIVLFIFYEKLRKNRPDLMENISDCIINGYKYFPSQKNPNFDLRQAYEDRKQWDNEYRKNGEKPEPIENLDLEEVFQVNPSFNYLKSWPNYWPEV